MNGWGLGTHLTTGGPLSPKARNEPAMGRLWDILSGKVSYWNDTRLEVHRVVYPRLQAYPAEKHLIRDLLFANYFAFFYIFGRLVFSEHPEIRARNYIGRVKSVNKNGFMNLASSYLCDSAVRLFAGSQDESLRNNTTPVIRRSYGEWFAGSQDEGLRNLGSHLIIEACLLYGRDQLYAAQRLETYAKLNLHMSAALLVGEVALVLGLDPTSGWEMGPWLAIRDEMEVSAFDCFRGNSSVNVTRELSRPPRMGGYPDSIMK